MDIEQLKLILSTLNNAGEGAFVLGVLWMLKGYFVTIMGWTGGIWLAFICVRMIKTSSSVFSFPDEMRRACGVEFRYGDFFTQDEKSRIIKLVIKGRALEKKEKDDQTT